MGPTRDDDKPTVGSPNSDVNYDSNDPMLQDSMGAYRGYRGSTDDDDDLRETGVGPNRNQNGPARKLRETETIVHGRAAAPEVVAWLYCLKGLRRGQLYQLRKERNEVGRAADCEFCVEDDFAGRHHGAIRLDGGHWQLFDFDSANGTYVNGKRLGKDNSNPVELSDEDRVRIGNSEFVFKCLRNG